MRVLVVGSGLAGLTTAYLLRREDIEVWLIEKSTRLGFHSASVDIPIPSCSSFTPQRRKAAEKRDERWTVDVPMRSFQGGCYPLLISLYRHLAIPLHPTFYTFSFSRLAPSSPSSTYFIHSGASGWSVPSLASTAWTSPITLIRAIIRFAAFGLCHVALLALAFLSWHHLLPASLASPSCTLRTLTNPSLPLVGSVWQDFIEEIVLPLFSAVGTMTSLDVWSTPVQCLLEYIHTTVGTAHYTLGKGFTAQRVAERLVNPIFEQGAEYLRLGADVTGLQYRDGAVVVRLGVEEIEVDRVVIATQASAASGLLSMLEDTLLITGEKEEFRRVKGMTKALGEVEYRETIVITHRDWSVLPAEADRRDINLYLPTLPPPSPPEDEAELWTGNSKPGPSTPSPFGRMPYFEPCHDAIYTMATHIIRPPPSLRRRGVEDVLQTTNPVISIDAEKVLGVAKMERALPLQNPKATLCALHPPSRAGSRPLIHLAGSYAYPGIPLLEGCVGSAKRVVEEILEQHSGHERDEKSRGGAVDKLDWTAGDGSFLGRAWRWRRKGGLT